MTQPAPNVRPPDGSLSLLVHAAAKQGKSTLASTSPPPILVLDVEGSWRFIDQAGFRSGIPMRRTTWDPNAGPPPRHDGTWEFCHVMVRDWRTLTNAYQWLNQSPHDFVSLVVDSISEAQRKLKSNLKGTDPMQMQDWGNLLVFMDKLIRDFRDLVYVPNTTLRVVVFVAETRQENNKWRPYMQGQISVALPYWVDIVGYLYTGYRNDTNQQPTIPYKCLFIGDHPQYEAGERVQGKLGNQVDDPHVTNMLHTVFPAVGAYIAAQRAQSDGVNTPHEEESK